jgi:hypothetical protein
MASPLTNINLIRTKTSSSPQLEAIEMSLRRTGYVAVALFLCVSFVLGVVYVFIIQEKSRLESVQQNLTRELTANLQKEGMFLSIKDRTRIVKKVMETQKPWAQLLDRVSEIMPPPALSDVTVDDQSKITISIHAGSVDTILQAVNSLISQANNNRIINPQLLSFQIAKTGSITATISFFVVF